jgi:pyruvate carboxylase
MPGGQFTNLREQAESMGLGTRWPQIAKMYHDVNMAFGDIVKVTPSSKVVGDMALSLVSSDMTIEEFVNLPPDHDYPVPHSVVDMFEGSRGEPEGGWPEQVSRVVLKSKKPRSGRPGEHLDAADFAHIRGHLAQEIGRKPTDDEVLSYLMYPQVFLKFDHSRRLYGDVEVLPTPQFFYGMKPGDEVPVEIEPGKTLIIKFLAISEPRPEGTRTVFFELNGLPREVDVRDRSLRVAGDQKQKADPAEPGQIGAPLPGMVAAVVVKEGGHVHKGDRLMVIEAMKMQTTIYASIDGKVTKLLAHAGQAVEAKDLLAVIS